MSSSEPEPQGWTDEHLLALAGNGKVEPQADALAPMAPMVPMSRFGRHQPQHRRRRGNSGLWAWAGIFVAVVFLVIGLWAGNSFGKRSLPQLVPVVTTVPPTSHVTTEATPDTSARIVEAPTTANFQPTVTVTTTTAPHSTRRTG